MSLKVYVAGRISRQAEVQTICAVLKDAGLSITRDWTWTNTIKNEQEAASFRKQAYSELNPKYHEEADSDLNAVLEADIFVILTDEQGSSMYVEMGAAFAGQKLTNKPQRLYAIGPHFDRMVFYQHHNIHRVDTIQEVIDDLKRNNLI